jgi:stress-induced morphogen
MTIADEVKRRIEQALPGAQVEVVPFSGQDHLRASVVAEQFAGKSRVEQHRLVYACLEGLIGGAVHALQLETRAVETDDT